MTALVDEKTFKKVLFELMIEQPDYFKALFRQIIDEKIKSDTDETVVKLKELDKIIDEDFARFDDVFRALA